MTAQPDIEAQMTEANATTLNNLASRFTLELLIFVYFIQAAEDIEVK